MIRPSAGPSCDDRWEIWSEGILPFGQRPEDLTRDHRSRPRNPLVADVFYRRGLIKAWGRGTQRIVELCVAAGRPAPAFAEEAGAVVVRFFPSRYEPPLRVSYDLTPRQREILRILSQGEAISLRSLHARMSAPPLNGPFVTTSLACAHLAS
jgi:ATP-dependent DNA helicase RecG